MLHHPDSAWLKIHQMRTELHGRHHLHHPSLATPAWGRRVKQVSGRILVRLGTNLLQAADSASYDSEMAQPI